MLYGFCRIYFIFLHYYFTFIHSLIHPSNTHKEEYYENCVQHKKYNTPYKSLEIKIVPCVQTIYICYLLPFIAINRQNLKVRVAVTFN